MPIITRPLNIGPEWIRRRELGLPQALGSENRLYQYLYSGYDASPLWQIKSKRHGGVFSLEFSPSGSMLVAACEKRSVLVFDPSSMKKIMTIENAHDDCVNCVKFINSNTFATCSDDNRIALWDVRNLSEKCRTLDCHENWVKSIEYSSHNNLLVSSGFDGSVLTWDLNNLDDVVNNHQTVFSMNGLMRTRLSPDGDKLIMCTTAGYIIVVHNLDLTTLADDLESFKPNMYRLMQLSQTLLPNATTFTPMFQGYGKRNRVEFISDFPEGDDAEVLSSLQVHPHGHSVVSRNVSNDEKTEWTCVHNIEECPSSDESDEDGEGNHERWPASVIASSKPSSVIPQRNPPSSRRNRLEDAEDLMMSPSDVWEAVVAIQEARLNRDRDFITNSLSAMVNRLSDRPRNRVPANSQQDNSPDGNPSSDDSTGPIVSSPATSRGPGISVSVQTSDLPGTSTSPLSNNVSNGVRRSPRSRNPPTSTPQSSTSSGTATPPSRLRTRRRKVKNETKPARTKNYSTHRPLSIASTTRLDSPSVETSVSDNRDYDPGEGTSTRQESEPSVEEPAAETVVRQQRRSKHLQRLRTRYEMNETARLAKRRLLMRRNMDRRRNQRGRKLKRVIMMGVFRTRGANGERGNSMRRHNIAALTVTPAEDYDESREEIQYPSYNSNRHLSRVRVNKKIHQNISRLTHYIEEPNVAPGFIKELCFSPDGRVICSPFGNGIRLLTFSPDVQDPRHCYPKHPPVALYERAFIISHSDTVMCTKFSPHHNILVSGCLSGKIAIYHPYHN